MKGFLWCVCLVLVVWVGCQQPDAHAQCCQGQSCQGQLCLSLELAKAPKVGWPWTPTPAPPPAPAPAPVVNPQTPAEDLVVEVPDQPGQHVMTRAIAAVVRAPAKLVQAIRNREHKPVARAVGAVGRLIFHRHRR
jgi:hypothetical protein